MDKELGNFFNLIIKHERRGEGSGVRDESCSDLNQAFLIKNVDFFSCHCDLQSLHKRACTPLLTFICRPTIVINPLESIQFCIITM